MTSDARSTAVDDQGRAPKTGRRAAGEKRSAQPRALVLPQTMTVQYLAEVLDQSPIDVIKQLMRNGIMASMNQVIDYPVATLVATPLGIRTTLAPEAVAAAAKIAVEGEPEDETNLTIRPPVVTVLGHVDHGKTSLLDVIKTPEWPIERSVVLLNISALTK